MRAVRFVSESPREDTRVIPVAVDHLPQLFEPILENDVIRVAAHVVKRVRSLGWHLHLNQDAVPIAVIQHATVLRPVYAGEDAV